MMQDSDLLRAYCDGSEDAFAQLVKRYVDLVFSTARRRVNDDALAQDVSQTVFCLLARKASIISATPTLAGWLYRATCFCAAKTVRREMRRRNHEHQAMTLNQPESKSEDAWERLSPILDDGLATLSAKDRLALLLRFFQKKPMRDVAAALGITEAAAKMRVSRSVEQLRQFFVRRGIACSIAGISTGLMDRSAGAAPDRMARTLSKAALAGETGVAGFSFIETMALFAKLNLKAVVAGVSTVAVCAFIGSHIFTAQREAATLPMLANPATTSIKSIPGKELSDRFAHSSVPPFDLVEASARLRAALRLTNLISEDTAVAVPTAERNIAELASAVVHFGSHRSLAFAILKEEAEANDNLESGSDKMLEFRAITAMGWLGKDVPEAPTWLWARFDAKPSIHTMSPGYSAVESLHRIGFDPDDIPKLAHKILAMTGPDLTDTITGGELDAFAKSFAAGWIAEIIQRDPAGAAPYLPAVLDLLAHNDVRVRFWAACALLPAEGAQNSNIVEQVSTGLKDGDVLRVGWACRLLQTFGDAARPIVPSLLETARKNRGPTRDAAFLAAGKIHNDLRRQIPEIEKLLARDEERQAQALDQALERERLNQERLTATLPEKTTSLIQHQTINPHSEGKVAKLTSVNGP
jgi:RNA polymerase sigma factor (sigma-70 family)